MPFVVLNANYTTNAVSGALVAHVELDQIQRDLESGTSNLTVIFSTVSRMKEHYSESPSLIIQYSPNILLRCIFSYFIEDTNAKPQELWQSWKLCAEVCTENNVRKIYPSMSSYTIL